MLSAACDKMSLSQRQGNVTRLRKQKDCENGGEWELLTQQSKG